MGIIPCYTALKKEGEGKTMNVILKTIANWLYKHGKANAGMASIRGAYEAPVHQQLQEQSKE